MARGLYKFLLSFFILFLFSVKSFILSPSLSHAQTNNTTPAQLHRFTNNAAISIMSTVTCLLVGMDPIDQASCNKDFDPRHPQAGGLLGFASNGIATLYTVPPASFHSFAQYVGESFNPLGAQKAYAQGIGTQGLSPLLKMWVGVRNIAYMVLTLLFVIVGLLVMLRVKIDARTVMTIQNQIPKMIIGIIAITFSFAIVGLLIDLMFVLSYFGLSALGNITGNTSYTNMAIVGKTPFDILGGDVFSDAAGVGRVAGDAINGALKNVPFLGGLNGVLGFVFGCFIPGAGNPVVPVLGAMEWCRGGAETGVVGALVSLFAGIAAFIAILAAVIRIFIALIKAYITILYNTILGPLQILFGLVPGMPGGFGGWLKGIVANLLIYPAVLLWLILGKEISSAFNNAQQAFVPPLIGDLSHIQHLGDFLYFGVIMMAAGIPDQILKMFKSEDGLGGQIMTGFGVGSGIIGGAIGAGWKRAWRPEDEYRGLNQGALRRFFMGDYRLANDEAFNKQQLMEKYIDEKTGETKFRPIPGAEKLFEKGGEVKKLNRLQRTIRWFMRYDPKLKPRGGTSALAQTDPTSKHGG